MTGYPIPVGSMRVDLRFKNSRFIGFGDRAGSVDEAQAVLARTREQFRDGSHHVYAFAVGHGSTVTHGMSDDGEPSGTAGRPVLAVLAGSNIGDVVVVVVRYFGGTKLGTGGLVRAYTETAQEVLAAMPTELKVSRTAVDIRVPYEYLELCKLTLLETGLIDRQTYGAYVQLRALVEEHQLEATRQKLMDISSGRIRVTEIAEENADER
jgi:uncharacterized YigZ family protein